MRSFGRAVLKPKKVIVRKEEIELSKPLDPHPERPVRQAEYSKAFIASSYISLAKLPNSFLQGAHRVFSKYSSSDVRDWGYSIAQKYIEIHGLEKPRNITSLRAFASTVDTVDETSTSKTKVYYKLPANIKVSDFASAPVPAETTETPIPETHFKYKDEQAVGYLYKRAPQTYGAVYRCLYEAKNRIPDLEIKRVLDYGSGTGSGAFAASSIFPELSTIICVEPSKSMRRVGKQVTKFLPEAKWIENIAQLPSITEDAGVFDLVICGYVLSDIESASTRNLIVEALLRRSTNLVLFVEPGTPKGFRLIHSVREWVRNTHSRDEACIVAPCPHEHECPLASDRKSWCHFSQFTLKYPKTVIGKPKEADVRDNEKYSFLLVQKRFIDRDCKDDLYKESFSWPRMVRPALKKGRHVIIDVCQSEKLERKVVTKAKMEKEAYRFARHSRWGDLWPFN